jgi:hypothetical protein
MALEKILQFRTRTRTRRGKCVKLSLQFSSFFRGKFMKFICFALMFVLIHSSTAFAAAPLNESFFYYKTFASDLDSITFLQARSRDPEFKKCNLVSPGIHIYECIWRFDPRNQILTTWINETRDVWDVSADRRMIFRGNFRMTLLRR